MAFPFLHVRIGEPYWFDNGALYVYDDSKVYELNLSSRWKETKVDYLDYKEIVLSLCETSSENRGITIRYDGSPVKSTVSFTKSEITSISVYECIIECVNETVIYDSHIVISRKDNRALIFEFPQDISDSIYLTVTDEEKVSEVIEKYDSRELSCTITKRVTL